MRTGGVHDGMGLYWLGDDGVMTKGWEKIDGSWYWFLDDSYE